MSESKPQAGPAGWVSYRPEIKVLDCTIRDGGLMNDHKFDDETVRAVYQACVDGGVDYMEIGYINSRSSSRPASSGRGSTARRATCAASSATTTRR